MDNQVRKVGGGEMSDDVMKYMDKVRDYYVYQHKSGGKLSTDEVVGRLLNPFNYRGRSVSNENNSYEIGGRASMLDLELAELLNHRKQLNDVGQVTADRPITSHRRFIGRFIVFGKKVVRKLLRWYINPIVEQQNHINNLTKASVDEMTNKLIMSESNFAMIDGMLNTFNEDLNSTISKVDSMVEKLGGEHLPKIEEQKLELERLRGELDKISALNRQQKSELAYLVYRLNQMQGKGVSDTSTVDKRKKKRPIPVKSAPTEIDYFLFENRFRGSQEDVKATLEKYVKYFEGKENVLDIGCGRGEFLELLAQNDIDAHGVDISKEFVEYCRDRGFKVEWEDAIEYLERVDDNSLGGIFLGQVIEHLDQDSLIRLVELSFKKLQPGAYFIAETPNPTMLTTFSNSFYVDLSHNKPIHPSTMEFLLEYFGFKDISVLYNEATKIQYDLPVLEGDSSIKNLTSFNDGIGLLNELLFGYQDYAICGKK